MNIAILTAGSRGDVQPYIALARGLMNAGHSVTLGTGKNFAAFVGGYGVKFAPLSADYYDLMNSPEGQSLKSGNPVKAMKMMNTTIMPMMRRLFDDSWEAAQGADALIFHPKVLTTPHIAEALGIPAIIAATLPLMTPTSAFPMPGVVNGSLGGVLNKLTYKATDMITAPFAGIIKDWRQDMLKLPAKSTRVNGFKVDGKRLPVIYCYSPVLVPTPGDWDDESFATGFWTLDDKQADWQPPASLSAFLAAGDMPVYIGFGSMISDDPAKLTRTVIDGIKQAGVRAIIASGWGGLRSGELPENVFLIDEAPHEWLFPRMRAVVHHGGAGTTAAGLRAGKPTGIVPFIADQPFWGARVAALGAGTAPISQKKLTAGNLAAILRTLTTDTEMSRRAAFIGEQLRAEDGVANAVTVVHRLLGVRHPAVPSVS